jgi:hypothetical protein
MSARESSSGCSGSIERIAGRVAPVGPFELAPVR